MSNTPEVKDPYVQFVRSGPGKLVADKLGLPQPTKLRRYNPIEAPLTGPLIVGGSGKIAADVTSMLTGYTFAGLESTEKFGGALLDLTNIEGPEELRKLFEFFNPIMRKLAPCARIVVVGVTPELAPSVNAQVAARALEGFTRSIAKELLRGATAQLVYVAPDAEPSAVESTLRFILSAKSAFVDGQVFRVKAAPAIDVTWQKPLQDKVAVVTGAARGIGKTIAEVLARDGAHVICVDIPPAADEVAKTAAIVGGSSLPLDVTSPDAGSKLIEFITASHAGVDIIVNNAGITRDKLLANMDGNKWDQVIAVNLLAPQKLVDELLSANILREGGAVIDVSSIAGVAGNRGQTNYGTTKAGVIGLVDAYAPVLEEKNITINAVAPGFIETAMTAAIPFGTREAGRLLSSLQQGGHTIDVAETIAYFANPASNSVSGNVIRVCGQALIGA